MQEPDIKIKGTPLTIQGRIPCCQGRRRTGGEEWARLKLKHNNQTTRLIRPEEEAPVLRMSISSFFLSSALFVAIEMAVCIVW